MGDNASYFVGMAAGGFACRVCTFSSPHRGRMERHVQGRHGAPAPAAPERLMPAGGSGMACPYCDFETPLINKYQHHLERHGAAALAAFLETLVQDEEE